jgi:hypothetical protein
VSRSFRPRFIDQVAWLMMEHNTTTAEPISAEQAAQRWLANQQADRAAYLALTPRELANLHRRIKARSYEYTVTPPTQEQAQLGLVTVYPSSGYLWQATAALRVDGRDYSAYARAVDISSGAIPHLDIMYSTGDRPARYPLSVELLGRAAILLRIASIDTSRAMRNLRAYELRIPVLRTAPAQPPKPGARTVVIDPRERHRP